MRTTKGTQVKLADLKGKVVMISFWATWCGPCQQELAKVQALADQFGAQGLEVLTVAVDGPDSVAQVGPAARRHKLKVPVLLDTNSTAIAAFNPRGDVPYTVFVDKQGRIADFHAGYAPGDEAGYAQTITQLLAEQAQ